MCATERLSIISTPGARLIARPCLPPQTYNSVDTVFHKIATKLMGEFQQWVETTVEWNG